MTFRPLADKIQQHEALVHRANRTFGGIATVVEDRCPSYEDVKQRIFDLAKETYGHLPAPDRMRSTLAGLDELLASLADDPQTPRVVEFEKQVRRVRAELVAIVESKRRSA